MNGEAQGGTNMAKMILGIVLVASGNLLAIKGYPDVPPVTLPAHTVPGHLGAGAPDLFVMNEALPNYFRLLMLSLALVNVGAIFLYQSRESQSK